MIYFCGCNTEGIIISISYPVWIFHNLISWQLQWLRFTIVFNFAFYFYFNILPLLEQRNIDVMHPKNILLRVFVCFFFVIQYYVVDLANRIPIHLQVLIITVSKWCLEVVHLIKLNKPHRKNYETDIIHVGYVRYR